MTLTRSSRHLSYAAPFAAVSDVDIFVLSRDGTLWFEHAKQVIDGKFGQIPPPRERVDGNVAAFQTIGSSSREWDVYVLGSDRNLWLAHSINGTFGTVPPPREQ
jgi:hypothetical protein